MNSTFVSSWIINIDPPKLGPCQCGEDNRGSGHVSLEDLTQNQLQAHHSLAPEIGRIFSGEALASSATSQLSSLPFLTSVL